MCDDGSETAKQACRKANPKCIWMLCGCGETEKRHREDEALRRIDTLKK